MKVLETTQTTGKVFTLSEGIFQMYVVSFAGEVKLQARIDNKAWVDTDSIFNDNGIKTFYATPSAEYQVVTDSAGAEVYVVGSTSG